MQVIIAAVQSYNLHPTYSLLLYSKMFTFVIFLHLKKLYIKIQQIGYNVGFKVSTQLFLN